MKLQNASRLKNSGDFDWSCEQQRKMRVLRDPHTKFKASVGKKKQIKAKFSNGFLLKKEISATQGANIKKKIILSFVFL